MKNPRYLQALAELRTRTLQTLRLGTVVEQIAKPLAHALGLPCLEPDGTLKPASPCARRRDRLNGGT